MQCVFAYARRSSSAVDVNQSRNSNGAVPSGFSAGKPHILFEGPYVPATASFPYYDISPDGAEIAWAEPPQPIILR